MAPFEALYGRLCRSLLCWVGVGDDKLLGLEMVRKTNEKISIIKDKMAITQHRQNHYANKRRKDLQLEVGDHVFLKVSPIRGVVRFGQKRGKLSPHYIGPFEILECIGRVDYKLALSPKMSGSHNVFHNSILRKYMHADTHLIKFDDIVVEDRVTYQERYAWNQESEEQ